MSDKPFSVDDAAFREGVLAFELEHEAAYREGREGRIIECPYPYPTDAYQWWTRGYSNRAMAIYAIQDQERIEALRLALRLAKEGEAEAMALVTNHEAAVVHLIEEIADLKAVLAAECGERGREGWTWQEWENGQYGWCDSKTGVWCTSFDDADGRHWGTRHDVNDGRATESMEAADGVSRG